MGIASAPILQNPLCVSGMSFVSPSTEVKLKENFDIVKS
jgi:hypothetical protein